MYYKPKNFELYELYPEEYYLKWANQAHKLWQVWDWRVLYTLQRLRERYGKMEMNNWFWGGHNEYKGWRPHNSPYGKEWSLHKFFKAADPTPTSTPAEKIRQDVLAAPFCEDFQYITCIEMNVNWFHFDTRNWLKKEYGILKV